MKRCILALGCLMLIASNVISQELTVEQQMAEIRANHNMILATLTALRSRSDAQDDKIAALTAKVAAIESSTGVKLASVPNWAGDAQFTAVRSSTATVVPAMSMSYGSMMGAGAGGCASGSWGSSSGRGRVFRR